MKHRILFVLVLAALVLAACAPRAAATAAPAFGFAPDIAEAPPAEPQSAAQEEAARKAAGVGGADSGGVVYDTGAPADDALVFERMVIKNGEITLLVKDSDVALDGITQMVGDVRGYIVSSQIYYQEYFGVNYKYATLTIGIPSDQFEVVLRRLRNMAIRVLSETASGQDVTDQFVDLQSQLTNLEATRDRIKSFLEDAKTVDEALRINQQLSEIEAQIEQVKGQMNYLKDRSAFSTITITVQPDLPVIPATATSTPRPTATPQPWEPGKTFERSKHAVTSAYQGIAEFLIWFFVVLVPILAPFVLVFWLIWRATRRKPKA